MAAERDYDIALVDLQIPDMQGEEVLDRINALPEDVRPIKVILTGRAGAHDPAEFGQYDVSGVLAKPFTVDELRASVAAAAKRRRTRDI